MSTLVPCSSCGRHVRASESACPFCDALVAGVEAGAVPVSRARRAVAFAATLTVAACTPTTDKPAPEPTPTAAPSNTAAVVKPIAPATTIASAAPTASAAPALSGLGSIGTIGHGSGTGVGAPATRYGLPPFLADDDYV